MHVKIVAGLTRSRSHVRGRSDLHSPSDVCTFKACATAGMTQDSRRTQAASSNFRHNSQNSRTTKKSLRPVARLPVALG
jgi:hypothetical protein